MVRYYPAKREDLFNLTMDNVKPYSLIAAVIKNCRAVPKADRFDPMADYCPFVELAKKFKVVVIDDDEEEDDYDRRRIEIGDEDDIE